MVHGDKRNKSGINEFVRKCIRIYPSVICACVVYVFIWYIYNMFCNEYLLGERFGVIQVIASLLLFHQGWAIEIVPAVNNPTWYLCVLILCYIVYYCINYFAFEKRMFGFVLIVIISTVSFKLGISLPFFRLLTQRGYSSFLLDALYIYCCRLMCTPFYGHSLRVISEIWTGV